MRCVRRVLVGWVLTGLMLLVSFSGASRAADFLYTGLDGRIISFSIPDTPDPLASGFFADPGVGFALSVSVLDSFIGPNPVARDTTFYLDPQSGGFFYFPDPIISLAGAQLFSGDEFHPTFIAGTFAMNFFDIDQLAVTGPAGTLVISGVVSGIPEPASLVLLGGGLLGVGVLRRRR